MKDLCIDDVQIRDTTPNPTETIPWVARELSTNRVRIDRVCLDPVTTNETVEWINGIISKDRARTAHVVTVNAQFVQIGHQDPQFLNIITEADLCVADGVPLVWASRFLGHPLPERVNGTDLVVRLCESAAKTGNSVYFMGGRPGAAGETAQRMAKDFPGLRIVGVECPPMGFMTNPDLSAEVARHIAEAKPDILFVGLGAPKQEFWIKENADLPAKVMIGIGGSFELLAGFTRRAPRFVQKAGCEWLWRVCLEPRRLWKRYLVGNFIFLGLVFHHWAFNNHGKHLDQ